MTIENVMKLLKCFPNIYLGTDFTIEDMYLIYDKLGNAINHQLTLDFIANGYDMEFLKRSDGEGQTFHLF